MAEWWEGQLVGFDLETTSADPNEARIVTASLVIDNNDGAPAVMEWLVNPGIEIPEEAAAIHGITTERAVAEGWPANSAVERILDALAFLSGIPLVIFNAQYDATVMDRETRRHGLQPVELRRVIDPYVLDKQMARYRKGSRKLDAVASVYGVTLDNAHNSTADVVAAIGIVRAMGKLASFPDPDTLHQRQIGWKREQQTSLEDYFRRAGKLDGPIAKEWPVVPVVEND